MFNIGITGSTGFIGKNIFSSNYFSNCFFIPIKKSDLYCLPIISDLFNHCDTIIHLAGLAHDVKNTSCSNEYYRINTDLTIDLFNVFLESKSTTFIYISSVKAASDNIDGVLTEDMLECPHTDYGKSKLLAEKYILKKLKDRFDKKVFILRPCMIHGPSNKGNLNLLYKMVSKGLPWPLGSFDNKRSFCSIDNICFIINELIGNDKIPSGVYNISDDEPLSTNDLIKLIAVSLSKKPFILNTPKFLVITVSKLGDALRLPLNSERLSKLTETYIVSNKKIKSAINKPLPVSATEGLLKTFNSFHNAQ